MDGFDQATGRPIAWAPQPGPQTWLMSCPIEDVLFGGARGGGKSDALLGDWLAHADRYGGHAAGIIFRRSVPQLEELFKRAQQIFPLVGASWIVGKQTWRFLNGATLKFRWLDRDQDADNYQGHSYTWVGADEIGVWPDPAPIDKLRATLRSAAGVPCVMRATANPGGIGQQWINERYIKPAPALTPFYDSERKVWRVFIPSNLRDNKILMRADPNYMDRIASSGPPWLVRAWLDGDWTASSGDSFFTEAILLRDGAPVAVPRFCDAVFATIDTAVKTGKKRDGTAVCYWALQPRFDPPLVVLDWDVTQIEGAMLESWLPGINMRLEALAVETKARKGNIGAFIEDAASGAILLQQAALRGMRAHPVDAKLTSRGKDERALLAGPYVYQNKVKITEHAYKKTIVYKGYSKNHFMAQVTGYRLGVENQEDDALDTFCYGVVIGLGGPLGV